MVKMNTMENNGQRDNLPALSTESACMDCIYWYQCRRGEIDCHLRPLRSIQNTTVRA